MNEMNLKKTSGIFFVLLWMILIFLFSAQPADKSSEMSVEAGKAVGRVVIKDFEQLPQEQQTGYAENIQFAVRKTAHALEYAVLGVLLMFALSSSQIRKKMQAALLIAALYAVSDEIHQMFVPGRSCQIRDVLIDSAGALAGILLFVGIGRLLRKYKTR